MTGSRTYLESRNRRICSVSFESGQSMVFYIEYEENQWSGIKVTNLAMGMKII